MEAEAGGGTDSANTIVVEGRSKPPCYAACVVLATTRLDAEVVDGLAIEPDK